MSSRLIESRDLTDSGVYDLIDGRVPNVPMGVFTTNTIPDGATVKASLETLADAIDDRLYAVATTESISSTIIPENISVFQTLGYNTVGDNGGSRWRTSVTEPTHAGKRQSSDGRWWEIIVSTYVDIRWFGAIPWSDSSSPDSRESIITADSVAHAFGASMLIPNGVFGVSDGITRTTNWWGITAPQLAPFPIIGDDKQYLRPGYKHRIPGSVLLFTGTGTNSVTTQRSDSYASFTYCLRDATTGLKSYNFGIVLDVDVYTAGGVLTTVDTDNTASYDVGHVIDDVAQCLCQDVIVFGYFTKAGTVIHSVLGNDDPDYNIFRGGSTMGRHGLSLIGSQTNDGSDSGLSGTQCFGFNIYSLDHHSRNTTTSSVIYGSSSEYRCIYIDGYTDELNSNINGHYFFGGCIRSYIDHVIELDHASQVCFTQCVFETPTWGVTGSTATQFIASASTFDVTFSSCDFFDDAGLLSSSFGGILNGVLTIDSCPGTTLGGGIIKSRSNGGVAYWQKFGGADDSTGDQTIQLGSGDTISSTAGWVIRRDISDGDVLNFNWNDTKVLSLVTDGGVKPLLGLIFPEFTIENISDATHVVNSGGFKRAGLCISDSTNHRLMIASGSLATDPWYVADGTTSVTPV